jgi:glycosyltransferase involved in cell wall biosynthesis
VAIVMQRVSEGLAARGHEVTVATGPAGAPRIEERSGVRIERFDVRGNEALGYSGDVSGYSQFVALFPCDVMLNYAAQICTTDLVFPLLPALACQKVIAPCGFSGLRDGRYAAYFRRMPAYLRAYNAAVYHSRTYQDARFAAHNRLGNTIVIPNGADVADGPHTPGGFKTKYSVREETVLLSVGRVEAMKGQDVVLEAFRRSRLRDAALMLVCPDISRFASGALRTARGALYRPRWEARAALYELAERHVPGRAHRLKWILPGEKTVYILAGLPRRDVLAAYGDADLFVFGSRVECSPLVIIEAMASGTPFVSTPVGNVPELPGGVIVRNAVEMATVIDRLAQKGEAWRELSAAGRAAWEKEFTWDHVIDEYERLYQTLVGS